MIKNDILKEKIAWVLMISTFTIAIITTCLPLKAKEKTDSLLCLEIKDQLKSKIDKLDGCGIQFVLSLPSIKRDSIGRITSSWRHITITTDSLWGFVYQSRGDTLQLKYPDIVHFCRKHRPLINKVLIELLQEEKYSWSSNLLLFHLNNIDGFSMLKFEPNKCEEWFNSQRFADIQYWMKKLNFPSSKKD